MVKGKRKRSINEELIEQGELYLNQNTLFRQLYGDWYLSDRSMLGRNGYACVGSYGRIYLNKDIRLEPKEWAYVIAHCLLHLAFGHFDNDKMPGHFIELPHGRQEWKAQFQKNLWNTACDIYVTKFLYDIKFGSPIHENPTNIFPVNLNDERKIYQHLMDVHYPEQDSRFSTCSGGHMDMQGLDKPLVYSGNMTNTYSARFAYALAHSVSHAVSVAGGHGQEARPDTPARRAAEWFIDHYPLLGGLAAHFKLIEDYQYCVRNEISVAAINICDGEVYINPSMRYTDQEWRFILAHEYLHAGLGHDGRCQGRNFYLWNVACDFVINGWLYEMQIGTMPMNGILYDTALRNLSAEEVYDELLANLRKYAKMQTLRGYGKSDIIADTARAGANSACNMDAFCKNALMQGLEFHQSQGRGLIPAGLLEEIRALSMPPVPWDVKLANWFDYYFIPPEPRRSYARPSRRQASTPQIPRPRYLNQEIPAISRTFGVVIDTSGSMEAKILGKALGTIASYCVSHDVLFARVVFCDAQAYDAGYLSPQDIAGRVTVKGRGGTMLQPGIDLLEQASDFPKDGPILIITDGMIENHILIRHEHAWMLPVGCRLPFRTRMPVFYF